MSYDFNEKVNIPIPNPLLNDHHGTRCAGLIAGEANNRICGVGVAYDANVSAIRILSKSLSTQDEAAAVVHKFHENHIYSCSWGPADNGFSLDGPSKVVLESFVNGLVNGRSGKGSIYVFAAGNGKSIDNCNFDGYANGIFSTTIGAIDNNNAMPIYMEPCSAQLAVVYSSGYDRKIVTTDLGNNSCTMKHGGTSAAAPIGAGIFALALSANPNLTWRDIQYLCVETAIPVSTLDKSWQKNGAGKLFSQRFGFGKLDADRFVTAAQTWNTVGAPILVALPSRTINRDLPIGKATGISDTALINSEIVDKVNIPRDFKLEQVTVTVDIIHSRRGNLQIFLSSPSGMVAQLATRRPLDVDSEGLRGWTFMTVAFWGETVEGPWTLNVVDKQGNPVIDNGMLIQWRLTFWGTSMLTAFESQKYSEDFINTFYPSSPDQYVDFVGIWSDLKPTSQNQILRRFPRVLMSFTFFLVAFIFLVRTIGYLYRKGYQLLRPRRDEHGFYRGNSYHSSTTET